MSAAARRRTPLLIGLLIGFAETAMAQLPQLRAVTTITGLSSPVAFIQDPTSPNTQFVVQQGGRIRALRNGVLDPTDFLNITSLVLFNGERGLLGLAFAPDYATSGRFFLNYVNTSGSTVIARYKRSTVNPLIADPATHFELLWPGGNRFIAQPYPNHKGGNLAFGPDGYLYIGLGDGGSGDDPENRAQNPDSLLGKMLRIDVNGPDNNTVGDQIPPDNPFVDNVPIAALDEIWAFGLRNPWRYSFDDPARGGNGALIIADVGQNHYEEINYEPAGQGGRNYGWSKYEGAHLNPNPVPAAITPAYTPVTNPIHEYDHSVGASITGGFVYRGGALGAAFNGRYFFADLTGRVWSVGVSVGGTGEGNFFNVVEHTAELGGGGNLGLISSFGVDAAGELYILSYSRNLIFKIAGPCTFSINPTSGPFAAAGGGGSIAVTTQAGCSWTANSLNGFVNVTSGTPGSGSGTLNYSVFPNTGAANATTSTRNGLIAVAGQTVSVTQTGCTFGIDAVAAAFGAPGGPDQVGIDAPAACQWNVTGLPAWISTSSGGSGTGAGTWAFDVQQNGTLMPRNATVQVAGSGFFVNQLSLTVKATTAGTAASFNLADGTAQQWTSIEAIGGRSYCASVAPGSTASAAATPTLRAYRSSGVSLGVSTGGFGARAQVCDMAPASETELFQVTQAEGSARVHRLRVTETTLWANWWFTGGDYSSFTLVRNTSSTALNVTITWRTEAGAVAGTSSFTLQPGGVEYRDARATTSGALSGSVEVAHDGEPDAIVGSQTTLSAAGGLSFDSLLKRRTAN
jgi:glucose/arabinose dehydrogenase